VYQVKVCGRHVVAERRNKGEQHGNWREIGLMAMTDGFEDPTNLLNFIFN